MVIAGWSSLVARRAHNPKVVGSNPAPATNKALIAMAVSAFILCVKPADKKLALRKKDLQFLRIACKIQILSRF